MKTSLGSAALVGFTLATVMACYAVSYRVNSERAGVERLRTTIAADTRDIRMLQAELRTRARLPELQRWNEQVLTLAPPKPEQFLGSPVVLASYVAPHANASALRYAAARAPALPRRPIEQVAYLELPRGAQIASAPQPAAVSDSVPVVAAPRYPAAPLRRAPAAPASLALDATLGGQIDAAAAAEAGRKAAMR